MPPFVTPEHDSRPPSRDPVSSVSAPRRSQRVADNQNNGESPPNYNRKVHPSYDSVLKPAFYARQTGQSPPSPKRRRLSVSSEVSANSTCTLSSTSPAESSQVVAEPLSDTPLERSPDPAATRRSTRSAATIFRDYNIKRHPQDKALGIRSGKRHAPTTSPSLSSQSNTKSPSVTRHTSHSPRHARSVNASPDPLAAEAVLYPVKKTSACYRERTEKRDGFMDKGVRQCIEIRDETVIDDSRRAGLVAIVGDVGKSDEEDDDAEDEDEDEDDINEEMSLPTADSDCGEVSPSDDLDAISNGLANDVVDMYKPNYLNEHDTPSAKSRHNSSLHESDLAARPEGARRAFQDATLAPDMNLAAEYFGAAAEPGGKTSSRQSSATSDTLPAPLYPNQQRHQPDPLPALFTQQRPLTISLEDPDATMESLKQLLRSGVKEITFAPVMTAGSSVLRSSGVDSFAAPPGAGRDTGTPQSTAASEFDSGSPVDDAIFQQPNASQECTRDQITIMSQHVTQPPHEAQSQQPTLSQSQGVSRRHRQSTKHKPHADSQPRSTGRPSSLGLLPGSTEAGSSSSSSCEGPSQYRSPTQSRTQRTSWRPGQG